MIQVFSPFMRACGVNTLYPLHSASLEVIPIAGHGGLSKGEWGRVFEVFMSIEREGSWK